MVNRCQTNIIEEIMEQVAHLVPLYLQDEDERKKADGNVSVCIIDGEGRVYGRMFGADRIRSRETYRVAWLKASQVWITGIKTGIFEQLVFNGQIDEELYGIRRPEFIGWQGGQPVSLADGTVLAVGVSGFRSATDLEIIVQALASVQG